MISIRRWVVAGIPFIYLLYLPVQSILLPNFIGRSFEIIALALYVLAGIPTFLLYSGIRIPLYQAIINLLVVTALPIFVIYQRHLDNDSATGGWLVMGSTVLLTGTAVRQHPWIALVGLTSMIAQVVIEYGPSAFISYGLVGGIVFVLAGIGVSTGIRRANRESDKYRDQQAKSLAKIVAIEAAEDARKKRLQEVLSSAVPMLRRIAAASEPLAKDLKIEAKLLELSLRDEIRGKGLLTTQLRQEISRLRSLGVEVAVLDEGGMDEIAATEKEELLNQAIAALQVVESGRVTLRSPKDENFRLTVVATVPGQAAPVLNIKL